MLSAMSFSDEGRELARGLENMRYYHRDGESFYLGDGSRLIVSRNENPGFYDDNKIVGAIYIPGVKNGKLGHEGLFINKAYWPGDATEAALFWSFPKGTSEAWEVIERDDIDNDIDYGAVVDKMMKTANTPVLIPLELAHWATELVIHRSDWAERPADESRPVWREIIVKNPGNGLMRTLIKVPSAEIGLTLTSLDENGNTREIPVVSGDMRDVFARKYHQEKTAIKRRLPSSYPIIEKPFADWEWELLKMEDDSIDARRYEVVIQEIASKYGAFSNFGGRLMMRDIVQAVRDLHVVHAEDLKSLRETNCDTGVKPAILDVVSLYRDQNINEEIIEDGQSEDAILPSIRYAYETWRAMRKILNMVTNYKHNEYFDSISPVQALVHLVQDNYEPHDIEF